MSQAVRSRAEQACKAFVGARREKAAGGLSRKERYNLLKSFMLIGLLADLRKGGAFRRLCAGCPKPLAKLSRRSQFVTGCVANNYNQ
jgi:hypothetical protein